MGSFLNISTQTTDSRIFLDESYKSGFKIGLGYAFDYDNWDLDAGYLWFHNTNTKSKTRSVATEFIFPYWGGMSDLTNTRATTASASWKLLLDMGYLNLTRPFYLGKKILLSFNYGLKGGRIDQKYSANYVLATGSLTSNWKSNSWLIGPNVGIGAKWLMGYNFFIATNASTALFYQNFSVSSLQTATTTSAHDAISNDKTSMLNPNFEYFIGIGYSKLFSDNQYNFLIQAGYEFQTYFRQNVMRHFRDYAHIDQNAGVPILLPSTYSGIGSLFMHGLTIKTQFDF